VSINTPWSEVLDYWFGPNEPPESSYRKRWFSGGAAIDTEIEGKFSTLHEQITSGQHSSWQSNAEGLVAAIIVVDQFSRNLYRNSPKAFEWDDLAIKWSLNGWESGLFDTLSISYQAFTILPLVHSEDLQLHKKAMELLNSVKSITPKSDTIITGFYSSAVEHHDIIVRFGRYPHRNAVLGRASTELEQHYLQAGAKRFGQ